MYPRAVNVCSKNTQHNMSRHAMLAWVNDCLGTDFEKIEDLCIGAPYCQLMNNLFPGTVSMKNVKHCTNLKHEYFHNFKKLQLAFERTGVNNIIPIDKLVKGKFQDNFEFLKWFKKFYDANYEKRKSDAKAAGDTVVMGVRQKIIKNKGGSPSRKRSTSHAQIKPNAPQPSLPASNASTKKSELSIADLKHLIDEMYEDTNAMFDSLERSEAERNAFYKKFKKIEALCKGVNAQYTDMVQLITKVCQILCVDDSDDGLEGTSEGTEL